MSAEFNQLRQTAAEFRHSQGPVRAERIEARLGELIGGAAVVSFDLFDTLTSRSVDHPVDLFHYLEFHPEFAKLGLGPTIPGLRVKAENIARREGMRLTGSEEILLPDIYRVFCALTKLSPGLVEPLTAAEEEVDLSLSLPNEGGRALFLLAEKSGKPIVILSDTYHRPEFILRLLGHFGYSVAADRVYCSSFHKKSKGRGDPLRRRVEGPRHRGRGAPPHRGQPPFGQRDSVGTRHPHALASVPGPPRRSPPLPRRGGGAPFGGPLARRPDPADLRFEFLLGTDRLRRPRAAPDRLRPLAPGAVRGEEERPRLLPPPRR